MVSIYLGYRPYPSLTWLFEGSLHFEVFLFDIHPGVRPRPNVSHFFVCEIYKPFALIMRRPLSFFCLSFFR